MLSSWRSLHGVVLTSLVALWTVVGSTSLNAQGADHLDVVRGRIEQLDHAGKHLESLELQRKLAAEIEKAEIASIGHPGARTVYALVEVAWHALLARSFKEALSASDRAHALAPTNLAVETKRAHALLLLGRVREARAIYFGYKGKPISLTSDELWEDVIAADIEVLVKAGVNQASLKGINAELGGEGSAANADLTNRYQKIQELDRTGRYQEAEAAAEKYVALARQRYSDGHPKFATGIAWLALTLKDQGRYAEAEPLYKRALAIDERTLGPDHSDVGTDLSDLAELYRAQGRYAEAEPLYKRALAIAEKTLGPDHLDVSRHLNNLALLYEAQGRYAEAEPLHKRALAIAEKALGPDHPDVGRHLNNLAQLYRAQGRYAEAEPLLQRALAIDEKAFGPDHPTVGGDLSNLAVLYDNQGRYAEAEPLFKRALAINEKALGPDHPTVGTELNNLAELYRAQGRYAEAEPLYKRALAIGERALGPDHPMVGTELNNLAELYRAQGRYADAEPLLKRALAIDEKVFGPDHPNVGRDLDNIAKLYHVQDRYAEAEPLYKRALAIDERALGPDHSDVGTDLNDLAELYHAQGRYAEAEPLYKRALAISEKALGQDHPSVGTDLGNLARLYQDQGRYAEAEPLYKRALAIDENAFGPEHPSVGTDLNNLAVFYYAQSDWVRAADYWRRSTSVIIRRAQRGTLVGEALTGKRKSEAAQQSWQFWGLVKVEHRLAAKQHDDALPRDMLQTAQWAQSSEAAESLAQMAARRAKGDPQLAALVRERQDLVVEWQRRDQTRSAAIAQAPDKRNRDAEAENVARLAAIDTRIAAIDKELAANFPDYAVLASPAPLSVEDVQAQLNPDEALVLFLDTPDWKPTPEETFIWVVTKTDVRWVRSELGTPALTHEVAALRCGLDYEGAWIGGRCNDLLNTTDGPGDGMHKPLPFDLARAHALYKALFGQIEDLIKDKKLLIVPSGPLTQFPFQVLVTAPPKMALPSVSVLYRGVAWLAREHAITVLPAVSSLKALRQYAKQSHASEPYIGFGDPLLDGEPSIYAADVARAKLAREKQCMPTRVASISAPRDSARAVTRGNGTIDIADIRRQEPLPETADELCDVARDLGVDPARNVYIGAKATEAEIKRLSQDGELAKYRIVHLATHGLVAGDLSGASEPGLLLTPPEQPSDIDDGYLSASEVAALKLDADWVILSACNTAAGDTKDADALSGLARAFFYAGARALLVSHWSVNSDSTVKLITKAVAELKSNPKIGRAEALRLSMMSMIATGEDFEAHPAFWAPFVLVGEGGAAR
jgi:tetratricopeptide (TPR) repeat protein/CHAT domain-containing protein